MMVVKMELGQRLYELRKKKGLSQEQVADILDVTRQTISKWETGQTYPDYEKLVPISKLYEISLDELANNTAEDNLYEKEKVVYVPYRQHYEYKSKKTLFGKPLVHINLGRGLYKANGIISIGVIAKGLISIGLFSMGLISVGCFSLGLLALGAISVGGFAFGGLSAGIIAVGGVAVGVLAFGGLAIGVYSIGGAAIALNIGAGGYASGHVAIGNKVNGMVEFISDNNFSDIGSSEIRNAIINELPKTPPIIVDLFSSLGN